MQIYRLVGKKLGAYILANDPSTQQIQGFLGDLLVDDELLNPIRDAVSRPSFRGLQALAGSGAGGVQRDALLQELGRSYLPNVVDSIGQVINGLLDQPRSTESSREKHQAQVELQSPTHNHRQETADGSAQRKSLPKPIDFFAKKFDPRRPMGRRNYILTILSLALIMFFFVFVLSAGNPSLDLTKGTVPNTIFGLIVAFPIWLLSLRRARAAGIYPAYIYASAIGEVVLMNAPKLAPIFGMYNIIVYLNLLFRASKSKILFP